MQSLYPRLTLTLSLQHLEVPIRGMRIATVAKKRPGSDVAAATPTPTPTPTPTAVVDTERVALGSPPRQEYHAVHRYRREVEFPPLDLVFVLDGSGSVGTANFIRITEAASTIVGELPVATDGVR